MGDAELDDQLSVRPTDNHVRDDVSEPVLQDRSVEAIGAASEASLSLAIPMQGRESKRESGGEQLLGEAVQRCLWSTRAGTFACGAMMAEVMAELLAPASHQRCPASRTATVAGKAGRHLGDVSDAAVWSLTEEQPLPRVGLDGTFLHVTYRMDGHPPALRLQVSVVR